MPAIVLQFSTEDDPVSAAIRAYGHGWCSHVDTVMEDGRLLGARSDGGVQIREPGYAPFSRVQRVALPCNGAVYFDYRDFIVAQVGKPYDMLAIAGFAADRDWRQADHWFCSELKAAALEASGFLAYPLATAANKITPPDLMLLCSIFVRVTMLPPAG